MRSATDCQVDCVLVQVVLAGTSPGPQRLFERLFFFSVETTPIERAVFWEFLVPLLGRASSLPSRETWASPCFCSAGCRARVRGRTGIPTMRSSLSGKAAEYGP